VVDVGWNETPLESFATIHVGVDSVVPAPHADFSRRLEPRSSVASPQASSMGNAFARSPKSSLSSFTVAKQTAAGSPQPALEVDEVRWPPICKSLLTSHAQAFEGLRSQLQPDLEAGRKVIAITGAVRGEGRTTLALCLAKHWIAGGIKVAIVDADFSSPQIASQLGLGIESGWETALEGQNHVWDVMIESKTDRLAILPLNSPPAKDAVPNLPLRVAANLLELAEQYELVIVDAGPMTSGSITEIWLQPGSGIDGWIVVHDERRGSAAALANLTLRLADAKQMQLGIAEMLVGS
jgi:Mrp family chromosome partitioning ATPase